MSEAKLFTASGFNGGITVGIRGDSYAEFLQHSQEVFGPTAGQVFAQEVFAKLLQEVPAALAAHNANQAVGPVSVIGQVSTYAQQGSGVSVASQPQPVAQPATNVVPLQQPTASNPPTIPYPGDCAHGPRTYKSTRTKNGQWNRWECAAEWRKGDDTWNSARCAAVNV